MAQQGGLDPDRLFGKEDPMKLYKLLEELAVGSYGRVYKVQDKRTNEIAALKVIPLEENDALEDFLPEIAIMKAAQHPNIVKFHGAWMKKKELFIAMELCSGGAGNDLYQVLGRALPEPVLCYIMREVTRALAYCHEQAIMHRDIKAANILFTESGEVRLTDFGVSCQMATPGDKRKTYIGTPYWVAPEIIMVNCLFKPYDNKVDIWSLGITCIELAETKPPHFNLRATRAMMEIPRSPAPRLQNPSAWSPEFVDFVARCTDKDPERRASARQLLAHPWFGRAADRAALAQLLRQVKAAKSAPPGDPNPPPPSAAASTAVAASVLASPAGSGAGAGTGLGEGGPAFEDELAAPGPGALSPRGPSGAGSGSDLASIKRAPDSRLDVDGLLRFDKTAPDRPPARQRGLSAQNDILMKRLQKQHVQELKKVLQQHMRAQEASQKEVELDRPKAAQRLVKRKEAIKSEEGGMAKEQISERDTLLRRQEKEMEGVLRTQQLEKKHLLKELRDKQAGQAAELAVYARGGEGSMRFQLELEQLRLDYELSLKHAASTHAVTTNHRVELYALARTHYKRRRAAREEILRRLQAAEYDHMVGEQSVDLRFLEQTHARQRDLLELTHLKQRDHMRKQQLTRWAQELQQLLTVREYREECARKDREWLKSREQESKGSSEIKRLLKQRQAQNQQEEERLYGRLMEGLQAEHRREEEEQAAQQLKMKELQLAAQKRIEAALMADHQAKVQALSEEHKRQKLGFRARSKKFQLDMLTEHQQTLSHALEDLHKVQNALTNDYFAQLRELKRKHSLAVAFAGDQVTQEQMEVGRRLSEAQLQEKKRAIETGAAAVQALAEQLDKEEGDFEIALSGDLLGTLLRSRTFTSSRAPAFTFATSRSATLNRSAPGETADEPDAGTAALMLSPRGRAATAHLPDPGAEGEGDNRASRRRGTDSLMLAGSRESVALAAALLTPQRFDPLAPAAAQASSSPGARRRADPRGSMAAPAIEPSRVTIGPEELKKFAVPKNPLFEDTRRP